MNSKKSTSKITLFFETAVVPNANPAPNLNTPTMTREDTKAGEYKATPPAQLRALVGDAVPDITLPPTILTINSNSSNWCSPCCLWGK